jgi:hypothetical protein
MKRRTRIVWTDSDDYVRVGKAAPPNDRKWICFGADSAKADWRRGGCFVERDSSYRLAQRLIKTGMPAGITVNNKVHYKLSDVFDYGEYVVTYYTTEDGGVIQHPWCHTSVCA